MKKFFIIFFVICCLGLLVAVGYNVIQKNMMPEANGETAILFPKDEIYGNTIGNVLNGGDICVYDNTILLATSDELLQVDVENKQTNMFLDGYTKSINVMNERIYYLNTKNHLYYYDTNKQESIKIKENTRYTQIMVVGNVLYGSEPIVELSPMNKCGGINLDSSERFSFQNTENAKTSIYYDGKLYYLKEKDKDTHILIEYDINNRSTKELFEVDDFAFSWLIDNGRIYYSYSDYSYEVEIISGRPGGAEYISQIDTIGIWEYDLSNYKSKEVFDVKDSVLIKNIIDNKLIYCDGPENNYSNWYILDLVLGNVQKFNCDGSCNEIYIANNNIVIRSTKDGVRKYRFYDENGNDLDFEVLY